MDGIGVGFIILIGLGSLAAVRLIIDYRRIHKKSINIGSEVEDNVGTPYNGETPEYQTGTPEATPISDANAHTFNPDWWRRGGKTKRKRQSKKQSRRKQ